MQPPVPRHRRNTKLKASDNETYKKSCMPGLDQSDQRKRLPAHRGILSRTHRNFARRVQRMLAGR